MGSRITAIFLAAIFIFASAVLASEASAEQTHTLSPEGNDMSGKIAVAENDMLGMASAGLPVIRYNDTLSLAKQIYQSQISLEMAGNKADYSFVAEKLRELGEIKLEAYKAMDELKGLEMAIDETEGINKTVVLEILGKAKAEFNAERYEQAVSLVDQGYGKISEEEAFQAKLGAFYDAASRGIVGFLREWWSVLLIILAAVSLTVFLTYNRFACALLRRRIRTLEERKESIKKLIMQTQRDYFDKGKTGEETYHIRTKKYAEMVRDINRQIPLLKEELEMRMKRRGKETGKSASGYRGL